jgi:arylsulfatase A-like enzyme
MRLHWLVVTLLSVAAAPRAFSAPPLNVILLLIDAQRADHLSSYGYSRPTSPTLDALAVRSVRFTHAVAPSNRTGTSMPSIWTGLLPSRHGVFRTGQVLAERFTTAAEILRERGYRTGAWCPNPSLNRSFGHGQGWDVYDDKIIGDASVLPPWKRFETASTINKRFLAWLDQAPERPLLAWLHYRDVHGPYLPPPPYDQTFPPDMTRPLTGSELRKRPAYLNLPNDGNNLDYYRAQYDGEIRYTDDRIKDLLAELDRRSVLARSVVIVAADHGEAFLDHGQWQHDVTLYEEEVHVPLIIARPGESARIVERVVSTIDLFPTILELAGAPVPENDGESLIPLIEGREQAYHRRRAYSESRAPRGIQRALRDGTWKLISVPGKPLALYDLASDAGETRDRIYDEPVRADQLARELRAMAERTQSHNANAAPINTNLRRQLESLGYGK